MFNEGEDEGGLGIGIVNVTAQAGGMMIDEMGEDEEFGNDSEMLGQD